MTVAYLEEPAAIAVSLAIPMAGARVLQPSARFSRLACPVIALSARWGCPVFPLPLQKGVVT